LVIIAKIAKK